MLRTLDDAHAQFHSIYVLRLVEIVGLSIQQALMLDCRALLLAHQTRPPDTRPVLPLR